jgi:hypothetical protein
MYFKSLMWHLSKTSLRTPQTRLSLLKLYPRLLNWCCVQWLNNVAMATRSMHPNSKSSLVSLTFKKLVYRQLDEIQQLEWNNKNKKSHKISQFHSWYSNANWHSSAVPTGILWLPWLRFFHAFSSVVRHMPGYNPQRQGTVRALPS